MLRILWVVALIAAVGAHENDPWKHNMKRFFEALTHDINLALRKSLGVPIEASTDSTYTTASTTTSTTSTASPTSSTTTSTTSTASPTRGCTSTASSTAYPVSQATTSTTEGCDPFKSSTKSSTQGYLPQVGSIRGVPGVNFPVYTDIPLTSFSCSDKKYVPGFYADMETGCQVFHVCWSHRMESFLCPSGTTFNQALLTCDYWYSSNCSLALHYYNVNEYSVQSGKSDSKKDVNMDSMINLSLSAGQKKPLSGESKDSVKVSSMNPDSILSFISKFLPVKARVTVYPETLDSRSKIVATASVGKTKQHSQYHGKHADHKKYQASTKKPHFTSEATTVSKPQLSTQSPEASAQKYDKVEKAVKRILQDVFETVQNILREAQGILAVQKAHVPAHAKHVPLTKLNPRFITKPVTLPKESGRPPAASSTTPAGSVSSSTKYSVTGIPKKPVESKTHRPVDLSVSSRTKEALTANYLRLLKIRKA